MPSDGIMTLASFISIFVVGSIGYSRGVVDRSGLIAGILVGSLFTLTGGYAAVTMLLTFFSVGSIFTKYKYSYKERIKAAEPRGGARGWKNVLSNLFFPSIALLLYYTDDNQAYLIAFLSSISCSLADTLGSELGPLDRRGPWTITDLRKVPHGTSGAISIVGTLSSFLGSFIIPLEALIFNMIDLTVLMLSSTLGFLSSLFDSLLGATLQAKFLCECDGSIVEDPSFCSGRTVRLSGLPWINNHSVNLISTGFSFLISLMLGEEII
ncbi:MAG: DUF92 domain-containing protein [Candidatus Korarchaeum sp.]|nr:DUF92 domain-containing protein [Candidatus Korarchaeum sp.]MDW8036151.1 DUF92 domain-containing protein [Candidatus Korarchaeum sp.]